MKYYDTYIQTKKLLDIAFDANRQDETAKLVRENITVEQAIMGMEYIQLAEEMGVHRMKGVN